MKTGTELIAEERQRQISQEGWTPEHDDAHTRAELTSAAVAFAIAAQNQAIGFNFEGIQKSVGMMYYPATFGKFPMKESKLRNLVIAGALIAAVIDRLQRLTHPTNH